MRWLVACEFSGIVREAFRRRGHDAWSCDLLDTEIAGQHIKDDVRRHLRDGWDGMIAHPPCTRLAVSGARYFAKYKEEQDASLEFVRCLLDAEIPHICLENPIGIISSRIRKPDQIIQPWMFGHPESKATCLWLKNLPQLVPTNCLEKPASGRWNNQTPSGQNKLGPSSDRWKIRSRTYQGVADAIASQWGCVQLTQLDAA